MKSSQLKFANPHLNNIDFEIIPNSPGDRFVGLLCVVGIIVTVSVFLVVIDSLPFNIGIFGPVLTAFVIYVVLKLFREAKKFLHSSTSIVKDRRAPIIYLRAFSDDHEDDSQRWDKKTSEELISSALKHVGPVLAVNDPRQRQKVLGATRIVMGANWREEIAKLISISQAVIVEANYTESLLWELQLIKKSTRPEQLIVSFLSQDVYQEKKASLGQLINEARRTKPRYERFDSAFSQIFGISLQPYNSERLCFFYFDSAWEPKPVTLELARTPFRRLAVLIYTPFIFSQRFERHLPFWKIKRALMLILHHNGIVAQKEFVREIDAERRKLETERKDLARSRDAKPQFGAGILGLVGNNEAIETEPVRSLLLKIDSFRPNKRLFIVLGIAAGLVVIQLGGLFLAELNSIETKSYLETGLNCVAVRNVSCAIDNCTMAIEAKPADAQAYRCLGDAYFYNGSDQEAIAQYDKAIELDPSFGTAYYNRAASYFNLLNYDRVISDIESAKERDPNNAHYFELSGRAYLVREDYENALRELRRAVQLAGGNASHSYYLSMAYEALGKHDEALLSISSAILLDSTHPTYYSYRAWMYSSKGQYDQSISDYDQAIGLGPDLPELFYNRGLAYCLRKSSSKTNDYLQAIEDFTTVIAIDENHRDAYWNRSFAHNKLGMQRQAKSDFKAYKRLERLSKKQVKG